MIFGDWGENLLGVVKESSTAVAISWRLRITTILNLIYDVSLIGTLVEGILAHIVCVEKLVQVFILFVIVLIEVLARDWKLLAISRTRCVWSKPPPELLCIILDKHVKSRYWKCFIRKGLMFTCMDAFCFPSSPSAACPVCQRAMASTEATRTRSARPIRIGFTGTAAIGLFRPPDVCYHVSL